MSIINTTIRPGRIVVLRTTITGNVNYTKSVIEAERVEADGAKRAKWETERVVINPDEYEEATTLRDKVRQTIAGLCIKTTFGLLCSEEKVEKLEAAFTEARRLADEFNGRASTTQINVFVIAGRVAADDVEAMRAINSEVRELMQDMETGLQNLDAKAVRDAAKKARLLGSMLSDDASERVKQAIETARKAANDMVKAAETSSAEIDLQAIRKITESRTAFLDITGDNVEIAAPVHGARALDFEPTEGQGPASAPEVDEEVAPIAPAAPAVKVPQLEMD
ncbi:hypothetical protein HAP48_0042950 [Bradyrhizobium septentrionale]|uniref:Uncharacterized protein n=1 Tax=Bradyrhizobium septentrionale TaxID=1404411 RepID=A0A974A391_9BRAD|nr:hypothetical protein [Bradyrhizobium septentrionale]UGY15217.1 hypothetical protein HAP48_0042950 [Bradyrhizobium septentrionale]